MVNDNIFIKYMEDRFKSIEPEAKPERIQLPFITISREYGCQANNIAEAILDEMRKLKINTVENRWKMINKEIIKASATELDLKEGQIKYVFDSEQRTFMDEVMAALSHRYYKSDKKIRKTISEVIRSIATQGNVIIVGRGGVALTSNMKNSFHIKLIAPLNDRIRNIASRKKMSEKEARDFVIDMDKKRERLIDSFCGSTKSMDNYDIIYNTSRFSNEEIATSVVGLLVDKKLV